MRLSCERQRGRGWIAHGRPEESGLFCRHDFQGEKRARLLADRNGISVTEEYDEGEAERRRKMVGRVGSRRERTSYLVPKERHAKTVRQLEDSLALRGAVAASMFASSKSGRTTPVYG